MKTTLVFLRHGLSLGNKEKKFTGQLDLPLTEIGEAQGLAASAYVAERFSVAAIYASDLSRAKETVRGLSDALALPIVECKDLREIDVGIWQGMEIEEVKRCYPDQIAHYKSDPATFRFEGGEAYADVAARAGRAVAEIAERHAGGTVAIATHGGVIRALRAMAEGGIASIAALSILPNASLCVAAYENGALHFTELGITSFLTGALAETEEGVK